MRRRPRTFDVVVNVVLVVALVGWWVFLRPEVLGGSTSYVIVSGASMEPTYSSGDLVVVRAATDYAAGDVVAFRTTDAEEDGPLVIHRIRRVLPDGTYELQGDNNDFVDPWHPTGDDIAGVRLVDLPGAGVWLHRLVRDPLLLGAAAAGLTVFLLLLGPDRTSGRRRSEQDGGGSDEPALRSTPRHDSDSTSPCADEPLSIGTTSVLQVAADQSTVRDGDPRAVHRSALVVTVMTLGVTVLSTGLVAVVGHASALVVDAGVLQYQRVDVDPGRVPSTSDVGVSDDRPAETLDGAIVDLDAHDRQADAEPPESAGDDNVTTDVDRGVSREDDPVNAGAGRVDDVDEASERDSDESAVSNPGDEMDEVADADAAALPPGDAP